MLSTARRVGLRPDGDGHDQPISQLRALLDPAFLTEAGWDPARQTLAPPPEHPTLGYAICTVAECDTPVNGGGQFCTSCTEGWQASGLEPDVFAATGRVRQRRLGEFDCEVSGCQRPRVSAGVRLCFTHDVQRRVKLGGLDFAAFFAHPKVRPLPGFGECMVPACLRRAVNGSGLCWAHIQRWRLHRRQHQDPDLQAWVLHQGPVVDGRTAVLHGLPALVQVEVLYGLQERSRRGIASKLQALRALCRQIRDADVASITNLPTAPNSRKAHQELAMSVQAAVACALSSPEAEQRKDVWNMTVFGLRGTLDFTRLSQPWLRAAVKHWVAEDLPTRRGQAQGIVGSLRVYVRAAEALSASLRLQRTDHGEIPALLGRSDIVMFTNRLAYLESTGKLSAYLRVHYSRKLAKLLRDCRAMGLTRRGGVMAGLPEDFTLNPADVPATPQDPEVGRALPAEVFTQLTAALPQLEAGSSREIRVAVRLLIDTGRRPDEICQLAWNCLERGADGKHLLIWANHKEHRLGRRLPISDTTAAEIREQQRLVRDRFPDTPAGELRLLPRPLNNPHGTHPIAEDRVASAHRRWVTALPPLYLDAKDDQGNSIEFDKSLIVPYSYRHSFAQRHADAGTSVDVLCALMDHRSMTTTQTYYRVTEKRTREAIDQVAALQFNGCGERVWQQAQRLLDGEWQRLRVGQVAVPYGTCSEPSNVKAGGGACPFRFRCAGCAHFRTDPSYLPELRAYLDRLLTDRERVAATVELEDGARTEAMPSEAEIGRIRTLIRKLEQAVEDLSEDEQRLINEAVHTLRATAAPCTSACPPSARLTWGRTGRQGGDRWRSGADPGPPGGQSAAPPAGPARP
jgi:integrase